MVLIIEKRNVKEVMKQLSDLENKYQHYTEQHSKTTWRLKKLKESSEDISMMLIDINFEIPRGTTFDCPIFHIHTVQNDENVVLNCSFKWRIWKKILAWILGLITIINWLLSGFCGLMLETRAWVMFGILTLFLLLEIIWIKKNIRHDQLTRSVFNKILNKTFNRRQGKTGDGSLSPK